MFIQARSVAKAFFAFILAATFTFCGFQGQASAQVGANFDVAIDVNQTVDQIIGLVTYDQEFVLEIANKTNETLIRVGAYNDSSNWPIVDVGPLKLVGKQFSGNSVGGSFSFAANYQIGNSGKYVQFAASWPYIGYRKIQIGVINSSGNKPAEQAWDNMDDADDKNLSNPPYKIRGLMSQEKDSVIWFYEVKS